MGDPHSHVIAHYDGKSLTANIETQTDTYVVEPMWRHLPRSHESTSGEESQHHDPTDMVVYRQSDVNLLDYHDPHSKSGFCQTKDLMASLWREQNKQVRVNGEIVYVITLLQYLSLFGEYMLRRKSVN